ncbi:hypothetical protein [Gillisia sp. JM1]|uniref:hypothetical protein n=1 Tax=Gillisia sp. JM1 TaxID=1283286 RepID=UPI0003F5EA92|nr:hypothetical protein [Gillisia sp. JM1]
MNYLSKLLVFAIFFTIAIIPGVAQSLDQPVTYGGIHFKIPADWFYNTKSFPNGNKTINSGKSGEPNSFTVNKVNADLSIQQGIDLINDQLSQIEFFKNAVFSKPVVNTFNEYNSKVSNFSISYNGTNFKGKLISFKINNKLYIVMLMGTEDYYNGKLVQNIMSTVEII